MTIHAEPVPALCRLLLPAAALLGLALAVAVSAAEGERRVGDYTVRWSTAVTGFLPRPVVEEHHLPDDGRGVLNVVVLKDRAGNRAPPTAEAEMEVTATNLAGQLRAVPMRPVTANGRTSYLGTFDVHHGDTLTFHMHIRPAGSDRPLTVSFERRFLLRDAGRE